jgi:hypothetical protein
VETSRERKANAVARNDVARQELPAAPMEVPPVLAPPASAGSIPPEAKKVNEEIAAAAPKPSPTAAVPASPQADMVLSLRDAEGGMKKESREKSALGAARAVGGVAAPVARVVGRLLEIRGDVVGQLYVYLSVGTGFRKVPGFTPMPLATGGARSFALPDGVTGTLFVLIAPQRDEELDRLADPHVGALPVRNWTRLNFN